MSLKPLDGFSLKFYRIVLICSCAMSGSCAHGRKTFITGTAGLIISVPISMDLPRSVVVQHQSFAHSPPIDIPMGKKFISATLDIFFSV